MIKITQNLKSSKILQRRKKILWLKIIFFCVGVGVVLFFLSWASHAEKFSIQAFNIEGAEATREADLRALVETHLVGNYLWLFSKKNIFLYPKRKIKKDILETFLRIQDARLSFADFNSFTLKLKEREPFALYCVSWGVLSVSEEEECYFMDGDAFIYARAMNFSDNVYFKYGDETASSSKNILGTTYLEGAREKQFEKVNLFIRFLKDININVYRLSVKENGDYVLYFDGDSQLIFDAEQDFEIILEDLRAVLIDLDGSGERRFEYIDLRFDNKVLYKFL